MAKCSVCRGCLVIRVFESSIYYCCTLCRDVYKVVGNTLELETDQRIIDGIFLMLGNVV